MRSVNRIHTGIVIDKCAFSLLLMVVGKKIVAIVTRLLVGNHVLEHVSSRLGMVMSARAKGQPQRVISKDARLAQLAEEMEILILNLPPRLQKYSKAEKLF